MKLYILRHGHSLGTAEAGVAKDFDRPLSEQGRRDVRRAARLLAERGARPELILHSPLKRTEETAKEASAVLKPARGMEAFAPLANELLFGKLEHGGLVVVDVVEGEIAITCTPRASEPVAAP